ncbi:MAG: calcium/sodium antiporter [Bacteroidales bacterium]|nr:calcium/sodium antiporter [Bacteroidales bacterium]
MWVSFILLIVGLVLILLGADALVNGASAVARKYGISEFVVGLTIVGIGTSAPELIVSAISAINGSSDIAIGNVVGSNISNVFMILGITAIIAPISLTKSNLKYDLPIALGVSLLLFVLAYDSIFLGKEFNVISRWDGLILIAMFVLFMIYSFKSPASSEQNGESAESENGKVNIVKSVLLIVCGLVGLVLGGRLFVNSGSDIARGFGVSDAFIGITVMAVGTSLPELAASVNAAIKKKGQMALGNVIGSNIFNILLILGTSSIIRPLTLGGITMIDMGMMILTTIMIMLSALLISKKEIKRGVGALFFMIYVAYIVYLASNL